MEAAVAGVGKAVLNCLLSGAKTAIDEDVATKQGLQRGLTFLTDELAEMQSFLSAADEERNKHKVPRSRVKQTRDLAYDVEDCLQDFVVHLEKPSWWHLPRTRLERHRIAEEMKGLRARVEDMAPRNLRYNLVEDLMFKPASITSPATFGIDEARRAAKLDKSPVDLVQLINKKDDDLGVIAVCGASGDLGQMSVIRAAYENPDIKSKFSCRAWVRVMHPFNPKDFIRSLVEQFHLAVGVDILLMEKTGQELVKEFNAYVNEKRYLIVLNDLSTIEDWDRIEKCFPNKKTGSRIIVSTSQAEIASLCAGWERGVSELKQFSIDQNIYAFHGKGSQDVADLTKTRSSSNRATTSTDNNSTVPTSEILEDQSKSANGKNAVRKSLTRMRTMVTALEESHIVGREKEKSEIIKLISSQATQQFQVISVCGMGGLGKTTLIKDIYESQELSGTFEKRAFVTIMRPFILEELLRSLVMQLAGVPFEKKDVMGLLGNRKNRLPLMPLEE